MESGSNHEAQDDAVSRKRAIEESSSSSSSSVDTDDEEDAASAGEPRAEKYARKSKRARQVSDPQFEFLSQQVAFLTNLITKSHASGSLHGASNNFNETIQNEVSNNATPNNNTALTLMPPNTEEKDQNLLKLSDLSTVVKDPIYPPSNDVHLKKLSELQRFNTKDWNGIRFAEVQKKYVTTPGFVEVGINDELKRFESQSSEENRLYLLERSFAAMTNALLTQKDELCKSLQELINWAGNKETVLNPNSLFQKVEELFSKQSAYMKVSDDILQMTCGRRADSIQARRELLLKHISDEYHREALRKIPPSSELLFEGESINSYIQKIGGGEKLSPLASAATTRRTPQSGYSHQYRKNDDFLKPSTSKQPNDKSFRNNPYKKDKTNKSRPSANNKPAQKGRHSFKGKKPRSNSPSRDRSRRA